MEGDLAGLGPLQDALKEAKREATRAIRKDKRSWVSDVARRVQEAFDSGDSGVAYKLTRSIMPFKKSSPAMVRLEDGTAAGSGHEARARWFRHFSEILRAKPCSLQQLAEEGHETDVRLFARLASRGHFAITLAPTKSAITQRHRSRKVGRAAGMDGLVGEIFRLAPLVSARALLPAMLKPAWCLATPWPSGGIPPGDLEGQGFPL